MTYFEMTTEEFLKAQQKAESEAEFQERVIELGQRLGWHVAHFRPVRVQRANGSTYYATPVAADGEGWPDLVLVRDRVIFAELKRENGVMEPKQRDWRGWLTEAGALHFVWKPSNWTQIVEVLR